MRAHDDVALPDLAYTLARRRAHRPVRTAVIASNQPELVEALREVAEGDTPYEAALGRDDRGPVWVFSGQGSQWAGMGAELLATEPVFAATVAQAEPVILRECGFSVTEAMSAPQAVTGQDRIQPTLFTMQVALAATMKAYGVRPGAVIGHSVGEAAAAVVAGALSLEDGLRVVCRRSRLMSRVAGAGATASVQLPAQQVLSELAVRGNNDVVVAVVASPESTVIAGAAPTVRELVAAWEQRDVMAREIPTDVAFHSPQVDPIVDELTESLAELNPMTPEVPFYSATLYRPARAAGVRCPLLGGQHAPHGAVRRGGAGRFGGRLPGFRGAGAPSPAHPRRRADRPKPRHAAGRSGGYAPRTRTTSRAQRNSSADLHSAGAAVDFSVLYPNGRLVDAPLPTWTHRRLWFSHDGQEGPTRGGTPFRCIRCWGRTCACRRSRSATSGRPRSAPTPNLGWAITKSTMSQCFPGRPTARWRWPRPARSSARRAEARDIRFEQAYCSMRRPRSVPSRRSKRRAWSNFIVETNQQGEQVRHAAAVLHAAER